MMKALVFPALILALTAAHAQPQPATPSSVQTYICMNEGKPVYTTVKLNKHCEPSKMDGISNNTASAPAAASSITEDVALPAASASAAASVPQIVNDEISRIWNRNEFGRFDDTVILPPPPKAETDGNDKLQISLRRPVIRHSPVINLPPKPSLTRRQILQQEIDRERTALRTAQSQLEAARRRNDAAAVQKYTAQAADRRQNLAALEAEMRR